MSDAWLAKVRQGDFSEVPLDLTWEGGGRTLAAAINGYQLAESAGLTIGDRAWRVLQRGSKATLIEILCALFFEVRSEHFTMHVGAMPANDNGSLDALCQMIVPAAYRATPEEIEAIVANIRPARRTQDH